jgi:cytochrome d ubiquinol oxidase subunit I
MESLFIKTRNPFYREMTQFWTKIFALTFAIGVATGIVMEFEFGTNWATYSRYVGDVFGSALAAEGVFAFFLESGFLAILLFGWDRVSPKIHFLATCLVCLGAHFSAIWIVVANSWMHTPAGYHIVGEGMFARAEITDFWAMVFNPSSMQRLLHVTLGAWLAGAFLVVSVSAYYILKNRHIAFARSSLRISLAVASITVIFQGLSGDDSARGVSINQPAKLAAFEGIFKTEEGPASLTLFGIPDQRRGQLNYAIEIPKLLSFLIHRDFSTPVAGLDQYPKEDWPFVPIVFQTYHLMIFMWVLMLLACFWAIYHGYRGTLFTHRFLLRFLVLSAIFPQIANQAGWVSAEMGRYPWIVQGLLRISEGLSKAVTANQVLGSLIMFSVVYSALFILFVYLLNEKITHGPSETHKDGVYPQQHALFRESTHGSDL